jgi:hypothetical protein
LQGCWKRSQLHELQRGVEQPTALTQTSQIGSDVLNVRTPVFPGERIFREVRC